MGCNDVSGIKGALNLGILSNLAHFKYCLSVKCVDLTPFLFGLDRINRAMIPKSYIEKYSTVLRLVIAGNGCREGKLENLIPGGISHVN